MAMNLEGQLLSQDGTLALAASVSSVLVTSGNAVLEAILLPSPSATPASTQMDFEMLDIDNNVLQKWTADLTNTPTLESGLWCGKYGIKSTNGLQVKMTNQSASGDAYSAIFLYRATT